MQWTIRIDFRDLNAQIISFVVIDCPYLRSSCVFTLHNVCIVPLLPLPNEDFGRPNQPFRMRFQWKHFSSA